MIATPVNLTLIFRCFVNFIPNTVIDQIILATQSTIEIAKNNDST